MKINESVTEYIALNERWSKELGLLRDIIILSDLEETIKWNVPVYTHQGQNILGLVAFKAHISIWFYQGVFLKDKYKLLTNANKENTRGLRQWRYKNINEIEKFAEVIKSYVGEAIINQKNGLRIKINKNKSIVIPKILQESLDSDQELNSSFNSFTLSKKREFCVHISLAKKEETKLNRLNKIIPMILEMKGLHDKYRSKK